MEVFIPFHEKDLPVLPLAIEGAKRHLFPAVSRIIGVGKKTGAAVALLDECGAEFVDEDKVIPGLTKAKMPFIFYHHEGRAIDRGMWYFQQLLKYGCHKLARQQYYAVLDADCVFVAPHPLVNAAGKYIFYTTAQWHAPYFIAYKALFNKAVVRNPSFIADHMIFDVDYLGQMLREIGDNWVERILSCCEEYSISTFSEFETYGNWMALHHADQFVCTEFRHATAPHWAAKDHPHLAMQVKDRVSALVYHNQPGFNPPEVTSRDGTDADTGQGRPSFVAGEATTSASPSLSLPDPGSVSQPYRWSTVAGDANA